MPRFATSAILICLVATTAAFAQANLPLGGYYRPGRCIPISIESSKQSIRISAEGAIPVDVQPSEHNRTVPFLILSSSTQSLKVGDREISIRALNPNEKLVALASQIDLGAVSQLFPGQTLIPVTLNSTMSDRAWEALDAIILDRPMDSNEVDETLANGTTMVIHSINRPDTVWPWKQIGDKWILKADLVGPVNAIGGELAYLPLQAWQPQQPVALRRQIVLAGVVATLLMLATLLIRNRRSSIVTMLTVAILCAGSTAMWRRGQPAARMPAGSIVVSKDGIIQHDLWRYIAAGAMGADVTLYKDDRPIFFETDQALLVKFRAECDADGSMRRLCNLPPNARLAVLKRMIMSPAGSANPLPTRESPLYEMARQYYLKPGLRIVGEIPDRFKDDDHTNEWWPTVVVGEE